jgi:hypothetical protein
MGVADLQLVARENAEVRARLKRLFWWALMVRLVLALFIHFWVASDEAFAPDQRAYHQGGQLLAGHWAGEIPAPPDSLLPEGRKGYYYVVGFIYFLFGPFPLVPKLVNCLVGALIVPTVFDLAQRMGASARAAIRAATFTTWFPSLVLWSALNIRDAWIVLLIALICRECLILQDRPNPTALFVLVAAVLVIIQFRDYILFAVTGPMIVSFLARNSRNVGRNVALGALAATLVIYADQAAGANRKLRTFDLEEIHEIRYWNTVGASSQFEQADISTPTKALFFLPKGLAYFLLAPFPWMLGSIRQMLAVPETLFFYSLLLPIVRGVRHLIRHHLGSSLMALLITAGLTLGYALGEGNAGTAYRHRAQLLSFFLIFAAIGIEEKKKRRLLAAAPPPHFARTA